MSQLLPIACPIQNPIDIPFIAARLNRPGRIMRLFGGAHQPALDFGMAVSEREAGGAIMIRRRHIAPNSPRGVAVAEDIPSVVDEVRVLVEENENHGGGADTGNLEELRPPVKYPRVGVIERTHEH